MAQSLRTLDQTVYDALRVDLEEKHHVDMVFTYFNEATAKTEYSSGCHKIAMAAKSRFLRHLLLFHGQEDGNLHLAVVGNGHMTEAEDLIGLLYDPQKAGKDITLWEDEKVRLTPLLDETRPKVETVLHADDIKEEEERWDGGQKDQKYESNNDEDDDDDYKPLKRKRRRGRPRRKQNDNEKSDEEGYGQGEGTPKKRKLGESRLREMEVLQEAESKFDLSLDKVKELVAENSDVIGYHEHRLKRIRVKFQALSYEGELVPYAYCVDCRKVLQYQPTKPMSHLYNHVKSCENDDSDHPDVKPAHNATILSHLFRTGSDRVERYSVPEGELPVSLSEKFDCVRYEGKEVPWAVCKSCGMVLSTKFKALGLKNLELHKCNTQHGKSAGSASYSGDVDVDQLEMMIKNKHPDVVTKVMSSLLGNFNRYLK